MLLQPMKQRVREKGGTVEQSITERTTHVICPPSAAPAFIAAKLEGCLPGRCTEGAGLSCCASPARI